MAGRDDWDRYWADARAADILAVAQTLGARSKKILANEWAGPVHGAAGSTASASTPRSGSTTVAAQARAETSSPWFGTSPAVRSSTLVSSSPPSRDPIARSTRRGCIARQGKGRSPPRLPALTTEASASGAWRLQSTTISISGSEALRHLIRRRCAICPPPRPSPCANRGLWAAR